MVQLTEIGHVKFVEILLVKSNYEKRRINFTYKRR